MFDDFPRVKIEASKEGAFACSLEISGVLSKMWRM
jgi:hypothetical protein